MMAERPEFPDEFEIEILPPGVFAPGRRLEAGEVVHVPSGVKRTVAIRWCTRRRPRARVVGAQNVGATEAAQETAGVSSEILDAEEELVREIREDVGNVATHDDPAAHIDGLGEAPPSVKTYDDMTVAELQDEARALGIPYSGKRRGELLSDLQAAQ